MALNNDSVVSVSYEDAAFLEVCNQLFSRNQEFIVVCNNESAAKCRKAAGLFLRYERQRPTGWAHLKMLAELGLAGMRAAPLMAVCNKATLLGWAVNVRTDDNRVLHLRQGGAT